MPCRSIRSRSDVVLIAALAALLSVRAAGAADSKEAERQAREHYKKGSAAFDAGRFEEAYKEFQAGYELAPRPVFILNMAHAERRRGELRNARALYKKFLLVDPQSKFRGEVEGVLQELDGAIAAEDTAAAKLQPPAASAAPAPGVAPPPVAVAPPPPPAAPAPAPIAAAPAPAPAPPPAAPPPAPEPVVAATVTAPADDGEHVPLHKRWWFWAGVGGVVIVGVTTALLLSHSSYVKEGSLGTLRP
jgi:tetratricopeptide (TPR) repeat protein